VLSFLSNLSVVLAFIGIVAFAITYIIGSQWRKTAAGRSLLWFVLSLVGVGISWMLTWSLGFDYTGKDYVKLFAYTGVAVSSWRFYIILLRLQKLSRPINVPQA